MYVLSDGTISLDGERAKAQNQKNRIKVVIKVFLMLQNQFNNLGDRIRLGKEKSCRHHS